MDGGWVCACWPRAGFDVGRAHGCPGTHGAEGCGAHGGAARGGGGQGGGRG